MFSPKLRNARLLCTVSNRRTLKKVHNSTRFHPVWSILNDKCVLFDHWWKMTNPIGLVSDQCLVKISHQRFGQNCLAFRGGKKFEKVPEWPSRKSLEFEKLTFRFGNENGISCFFFEDDTLLCFLAQRLSSLAALWTSPEDWSAFGCLAWERP